MIQQSSNPFSTTQIRCPVEQFEVYEKYCLPRSTLAALDSSPFRTFADLWYMGICLAVRQGLEQVDVSQGKTRRLAPGLILDKTPWRTSQIKLISVAVAGDEKVLVDPDRMMAIANGLAAAGVPEINEIIQSDEQPPIWALSDALHHMLAPSTDSPSRDGGSLQSQMV